jgi:hypothetical protein
VRDSVVTRWERFSGKVAELAAADEDGERAA